MSSEHWCTPPEVVDLVRKVLHTIELDPFSNRDSQTNARMQLFGPDVDGHDGFEEPWDACTVFFNPPWRRSGDAVRKAQAEWEAGHALEIIGLVPTSLNAKHWPIVEQAPAVCTPNKRINFFEDGVQKKGNPKDVVLIYWGNNPWRFRAIFSELGRVKIQ